MYHDDNNGDSGDDHGDHKYDDIWFVMVVIMMMTTTTMVVVVMVVMVRLTRPMTIMMMSIHLFILLHEWVTYSTAVRSPFLVAVACSKLKST